MLSCLVAQVLLGALLILLLLRTVAQGFLFSGLHYLIDDAEPSSPRGLQARSAMRRFGAFYFFSGKKK
jgi:hypothetical protein